MAAGALQLLPRGMNLWCATLGAAAVAAARGNGSGKAAPGVAGNGGGAVQMRRVVASRSGASGRGDMNLLIVRVQNSITPSSELQMEVDRKCESVSPSCGVQRPMLDHVWRNTFE